MALGIPMKKEKGHNLVLSTITILLVLLLAHKLAAQTAGPQGYLLIGTIQSEDFTGAVIKDPAGEQSFYRLNDKLPDGSQVLKVEGDSILLRRTDGVSYELFITHDTKTAAQANHSASVNPTPSVRPTVPVNPYASGPPASGTPRKIGPEQKNSRVRPPGRLGRQPTDE